MANQVSIYGAVLAYAGLLFKSGASFLRLFGKPRSVLASGTVLSCNLRSLYSAPSAVPVTITMGGGPKIPYPKHVWSPAGGWYAQPANWKRNTAIAGLAVVGITAIVWKIDSELEYRHKMPEPGRFFPSRYWSRQIIEHEKAQKALQAQQEESK